MKQTKKTTVSTNSIKLPLWVVLLGLLCFFVVGGRVSYLALSKTVDGIDIQNFASNRNSTYKVLKADRGTIYDINGNVLYENIPKEEQKTFAVVFRTAVQGKIFYYKSLKLFYPFI